MHPNKLINRWTTSNKDINSQLVISENLLDNFFGTKIAAQSMDEEACKILSAYVALTRAMYMLHQQNHWDAQAYSDHLLFQRLYEDAQTLSDDAAERTMGLCGNVVFKGEEGIVQKFSPKTKTLSSLLESSLEIEKAFQNINKTTYDLLKAKDMLTLGLDDLLMSQASQGEVHIYLLQQAIKGLLGDNVADHAKDIIEKTESFKSNRIVRASKKHKIEYKPKDIIDYIEAALKVRPYDEIVAYIKNLDHEILDQVINILMKTNPGLLKKIFVSTIVNKPQIENLETHFLNLKNNLENM